jgi:predicted RNA-binding protein with TRAM domain
MAASATRKKDITIHGAGGARVETGVIVFDNDATVEVPTKLGVIYSASFTKVGDAGDANALSVYPSPADSSPSMRPPTTR